MRKMALVVLLLVPVLAFANMNSEVRASVGKVLLMGIGIGSLALVNLSLAILNMKWKNIFVTVFNSIVSLPLIALTILAFKWHFLLGILVAWVTLAHIVLISKSKDAGNGKTCKKAEDQLQPATV